MKRYNNLKDFYNGDDWAMCKQQVLNDRITSDGKVICEHCKKEIVKDFNPNKRNNRNAIVYHHKIELNIANVNDASISINPENIATLHWQCHNEVHNRFCGTTGNNLPTKKVYLITGPSCSGKTSFVKERATDGDIVVDIDDIWQFVTRDKRYYKPKWAQSVVFAIRDAMIDRIITTKLNGTWHNAFIIESLPFGRDRDERASQLQAEIIEMEATEEECLQRLYENPDGRSIRDYEKYIKDYFKRCY